jgi:hypothetical protein
VNAGGKPTFTARAGDREASKTLSADTKADIKQLIFGSTAWQCERRQRRGHVQLNKLRLKEEEGESSSDYL